MLYRCVYFWHWCEYYTHIIPYILPSLSDLVSTRLRRYRSPPFNTTVVRKERADLIDYSHNGNVYDTIKDTMWTYSPMFRPATSAPLRRYICIRMNVSIVSNADERACPLQRKSISSKFSSHHKSMFLYIAKRKNVAHVHENINNPKHEKNATMIDSASGEEQQALWDTIQCGCSYVIEMSQKDTSSICMHSAVWNRIS
jgi:hypothetical protein